jgi:hypothetical protein
VLEFLTEIRIRTQFTIIIIKKKFGRRACFTIAIVIKNVDTTFGGRGGGGSMNTRGASNTRYNVTIGNRTTVYHVEPISN